MQTPAGARVGRRVFAQSETLHAPHLLDVEVMQALRRYVAIHGLAAARAEEVVRDLMDLRIRRYPHTLFLARVWSLRSNFSAYDAVYVALAETLGATLLTCDAKLGAAPGHRANIKVV